MKRLIAFFVLILGFGALLAQDVIYIQSVFDDNLSEWVILDEEEEEVGLLKVRFGVKQNHADWIYEWGELRGEIRLKWMDDYNLWELRGDGVILSGRTNWTNDFTEWRISDNDIEPIILRSKFKSPRDEWLIRRPADTYFYMYTLYQNDYRDWVIEFDSKQLNEHEVLMLVFLSMFNAPEY